MAKWNVRRFYSSYVDTVVEADDEDEAKAVVGQMSINTDVLVENRTDEGLNVEVTLADDDEEVSIPNEFDKKWAEEARRRYKEGRG